MLIDAYEQVVASPRLTAVKVRVFGDESALAQPGANPRMIWIPTTDTFGPPDTLMTMPGVSEGRRVIFTSRWLRSAGVRIHLFTDYGPNGQRQMEDLINQLLMAMYEAVLAPGMNFALGNGEWIPRSAIADKSIEVVLSATFGVPIWDAPPAQLLGAVTTTY